MTFGSTFRRERAAAGDEWVFVYEWFAGWRWEHYRRGGLHNETLESYETVRECVRHASLHGYRSPKLVRTRLNPTLRLAAHSGSGAAATEAARAAA